LILEILSLILIQLDLEVACWKLDIPLKNEEKPCLILRKLKRHRKRGFEAGV